MDGITSVNKNRQQLTNGLGCIALCLAASHTSASEQKLYTTQTPGWHGYFAVLAGFSKVQSQFNTQKHEITDSLYNNGDSKSSSVLAPTGQLRYVLEDTTKELYMGTGKEDISRGSYHFEMGYQQQLDSGTRFNFGIIPNLIAAETWSDPFISGTERDTTQSNLHAIRLKADHINNSPFSFAAIYGRKTIDEEQSGEQLLTKNEQELIKRDTTLSSVETSYKWTLKRNHYLTSRIKFNQSQADGEAMSYNGYGVEFNYIHILPRALLSLSWSYKQNKYQENHPVYDDKRKETRSGLVAIFEYKRPFNWQQWSSVFMISNHQTNSNIDFYDKKSALFATGLKYRF